MFEMEGLSYQVDMLDLTIYLGDLSENEKIKPKVTRVANLFTQRKMNMEELI